MECYCCGRAVSLTHRVQLRGDVRTPPSGFASPDEPGDHAYLKHATFRTAFICPACYDALDNDYGAGEIGGRVYNLAGRSRGGKAAVYNEAKYRAYQRRLAAELGVDDTPQRNNDDCDS